MMLQALQPLKWFVVSLLFCMAGAALAATVNGIEIDEQATAQAPWKANEMVPYSDKTASLGWLGTYKVYRVFLGVTPQGYYVVQDFYADSNAKLSDPYVVRNERDVEDERYDTRYMTIEGLYIVWYPNGQKSIEGRAVNGKEEGEWRFWYSNGQLAGVSPYVSGKRNGWGEEWSEGGVMVQRCHFKDNSLDGVCTTYFENGGMSSEKTYSQGRLVGQESWWHDNGQLHRQGSNDEHSNRQGEWREWDRNGNLVQQSWYEDDQEVRREAYRDDSAQAQIVDRTTNGIEIDKQATIRAPWPVGEKIPGSDTYVNRASCLGQHNVYRVFWGVTPQGYYVVQDFYADNNVKLTDPYVVRTVRDVEQESYYAPGGMAVEGLYTVWYRDGQKYSEVLMVNGKRSGWEMQWSEGGQITSQYYFKEDVPDGICIRWYENGVKSTEMTYKQGLPVGLEMWWHDNKQLQMLGRYDAHGQRQGEWREWDRNGNLISQSWHENDGREVRREMYTAGRTLTRNEDGTVNGIVIDERATAQAAWRVGERILGDDASADKEYFRVFLGITPQGGYVIQDFYKGYFGEGVSSPKRTDPYVVGAKECLEQESGDPSDMVFEGMYTSWFPEEQKQYQAFMVDGVKEGEWKFWGYGGRLAASTSYVNGERSWHELWEPVHYRCHYRDEITDDVCMTWHHNGIQLGEERYRQGVRTGLQSWWHDNGQMQGQVIFNENGKPHGEARGYDKDGNLVERIWFENGKEVRREDYSAK